MQANRHKTEVRTSSTQISEHKKYLLTTHDISCATVVHILSPSFKCVKTTEAANIVCQVFLPTVHARSRWLCLPTAFYPVYNQSFLMQIFPHAMKPNYSALSLMVFACVSSPPTFLLTRHIQALPFSSHDQRMQIVFS
ncbi:hypothetical protein BsWGS_13657 [Bradybaena similaris]